MSRSVGLGTDPIIIETLARHDTELKALAVAMTHLTDTVEKGFASRGKINWQAMGVVAGIITALLGWVLLPAKLTADYQQKSIDALLLRSAEDVKEFREFDKRITSLEIFGELPHERIQNRSSEGKQ